MQAGQDKDTHSGGLLTLSDVCAMTQKSHTTIRNWIKAGKFPKGQKFGWVHLWAKEEVEGWIKKNELEKSGQNIEDAKILEVLRGCYEYLRGAKMDKEVRGVNIRHETKLLKDLEAAIKHERGK